MPHSIHNKGNLNGDNDTGDVNGQGKYDTMPEADNSDSHSKCTTSENDNEITVVSLTEIFLPVKINQPQYCFKKYQTLVEYEHYTF